MKVGSGFTVALFSSVSEVMKAESILNGTGIHFKLIPVPKRISPDCGVCVRFSHEDRWKIEQALRDKVTVSDYISLDQQVPEK